MIILGLNRGDHDGSACIVQDGRVRSFINVERLTRIKHGADRIWEAIRYCLDLAGVTRDDVDLIVQNSYTCDLEVYDALSPSVGRQDETSRYMHQFKDVITIPHHLAHAYCGIGLSPFYECAVMVIDGVGQQIRDSEYEAESYYYFKDLELKELFRQFGSFHRDGLSFPSFDSIGAVYSVISSYIFGHWNHCGKVMGLAPYGSRERYDWKIISEKDGTLSFNHDFRRDLHCPRTRDSDWEKHEEEYREISFVVQEEVERVLIRLARWLHRKTGSRNLVISGGVGLNCVANQRILESTPFERIFVPPACGDDGISIGCAYYGWFRRCRGKKVFSLDHPYFGKDYSEAEILEALAADPTLTYRKSLRVGKEAARRIEQGKVVGWFQGASAIGPRALGNRSILADPRDPQTKDRVNRKVKHREPFRPFGASVMAEKTGEYFECDEEKSYMTFAARVKKQKRREIAAVVHVDNTCRIQTVRPDQNPRYYGLLREFYQLTGVPMVLNTSFNTQGEPIVETPGDALACFLASDMDALAIGDYLVEKRSLWNGHSMDPCILDYAIASAKQFDVVEHIYPGGRVEYSIRWRFPREGRIEGVHERMLDALRFLDRHTRLRDMLESLGVGSNSEDGKDLVGFLVQLKVQGLVRLESVP